MRLLDQYLLRELLIPFVICFGGVLVFFNVADLFNELPRYQNNGMSGLDILEYYVYKLPSALPTLWPASLLLGLLYAISRHSKNNEFTAARAAGVSIWRLTAPYLVVGAVSSLLLFWSNEWIEPAANKSAERILNRRIEDPGAATALDWRTNVSFKNETAKRSWNIGAFNRYSSEMLRVSVEWIDADDKAWQLFAEKGQRRNNAWEFENVVIFSPDPMNAGFPLRTATNTYSATAFTETPELIESEIKISSMNSVHAAKRIRFSLGEILNYLRLHPNLKGPKAAELSTQLHGRLALPWRCLVVVLIAIPFGCLPGRRSVGAGIGMAVFIGFAFLFLGRVSLALGTGGHLPGLIAGWLPLLVFGGAGVWAVRRLA